MRAAQRTRPMYLLNPREHGAIRTLATNCRFCGRSQHCGNWSAGHGIPLPKCDLLHVYQLFARLVQGHHATQQRRITVSLRAHFRGAGDQLPRNRQILPDCTALCCRVDIFQRQDRSAQSVGHTPSVLLLPESFCGLAVQACMGEALSAIWLGESRSRLKGGRQ